MARSRSGPGCGATPSCAVLRGGPCRCRQARRPGRRRGRDGRPCRVQRRPAIRRGPARSASGTAPRWRWGTTEGAAWLVCLPGDRNGRAALMGDGGRAHHRATGGAESSGTGGIGPAQSADERMAHVHHRRGRRGREAGRCGTRHRRGHRGGCPTGSWVAVADGPGAGRVDSGHARGGAGRSGRRRGARSSRSTAALAAVGRPGGDGMAVERRRGRDVPWAMRRVGSGGRRPRWAGECGRDHASAGRCARAARLAGRAELGRGVRAGRRWSRGARVGSGSRAGGRQSSGRGMGCGPPQRPDRNAAGPGWQPRPAGPGGCGPGRLGRAGGGVVQVLPRRRRSRPSARRDPARAVDHSLTRASQGRRSLPITRVTRPSVTSRSRRHRGLSTAPARGHRVAVPASAPPRGCGENMQRLTQG
jgi:hypothetical protein